MENTCAQLSEMGLKARTDGAEHDGAELGPSAPSAGGLVSVLRHSSELNHIILETFSFFVQTEHK